MKTILTILMILKFNILMAGALPNWVVSPTQPEFGTGVAHPPYAGQSSRLWELFDVINCFTRVDTHVNYVGNDVNVFVLLGSGVCADPPPPFYVPVTDIIGLDEGTYNLNYYSVPDGDLFPPLIVNYPIYFRDNIQFNVLQPIVIDSSSKSSLFILTLFLLFIGSFMIRKYQ